MLIQMMLSTNWGVCLMQKCDRIVKMLKQGYAIPIRDVLENCTEQL